MSPWRLLLTRPAEECAALALTLADEKVSGTVTGCRANGAPSTVRRSILTLQLAGFLGRVPRRYASPSIASEGGAALSAVGVNNLQSISLRN